MIAYFQGDITEARADVIVNAANGIGFMGGVLGRLFKFSGVAESIHYHTKGVVEREALKEVFRRRPWVGDVYVTSAANLEAKYIFHAVTMYLPGTLSSAKIIEKCLKNIICKAVEMKIHSVAIPALGAGTGLVKIHKVAWLYRKYLIDSDMEFIIVDPTGRFIETLTKIL